MVNKGENRVQSNLHPLFGTRILATKTAWTEDCLWRQGKLPMREGWLLHGVCFRNSLKPAERPDTMSQAHK